MLFPLPSPLKEFSGPHSWRCCCFYLAKKKMHVPCFSSLEGSVGGLRRLSCRSEGKCLGKVLLKSVFASFFQLACTKSSSQPWEDERRMGL